METALGVFVMIALWGCIAVLVYATVQQVRRNRVEGRRVPLPWWSWIIVAAVGIVLGILYGELIS